MICSCCRIPYWYAAILEFGRIDYIAVSGLIVRQAIQTYLS